MSNKDIFNYSEDGFYQFITEFYPDSDMAKRMKIILESRFSTEKINYLILVELVLTLDRIEKSMQQLVFND